MNTEKELLEIMDQVDGSGMEVADKDMMEAILPLKRCASKLKELQMEKVSTETDERFKIFLDSISDSRKTNHKNKLRSMIIISAIAAGIALFVIYNPFQNNEILESFSALKSNPDKLSFVYELNSEKLNKMEIDDVKLLLMNEQNPNIKVAILDLLGNYTPQYVEPRELFSNLNKSSTPSVQMAMLNNLEAIDISAIRYDLDQFQHTADLEDTVKNKIQEMLNNTKSKNIK